MVNDDVKIAICNPSDKMMDYYYKNGEADEVIYIHEGQGKLYSQFGSLSIRKGDYVVIPRTVIYKIEWEEGTVRLLITETSSPIETVRRYTNELGQLLEHSPYCERDLRPPEELNPELDKGIYQELIKPLLHR